MRKHFLKLRFEDRDFNVIRDMVNAVIVHLKSPTKDLILEELAVGVIPFWIRRSAVDVLVQGSVLDRSRLGWRSDSVPSATR